LDGLHGYPRPQLERTNWTCLDGEWEFALDPEARWTLPHQPDWTARILVPFSPETPASGIGNSGFYRACWYRRTFELPAPAPGQHLLLHFGAVDYAATVWLNGRLAMEHAGGYTPFACDVTEFLNPGAPQVLTVRAEDDPADLSKPRGKQDWQLHPHSIWYPRTSGIWQSVWYEIVPSTWIDSIRWVPNVERWELGFEAWLEGERREGLRLNVKLFAGDTMLADDTYTVVAGEVHRRIALSDPGIDDYRNELLWSPEKPTLMDARIPCVSCWTRVTGRIPA
jgi:beta-galactosidase/beta-glucuronidase